jgi:Pyruvate/2-oxoacid:ferredoxin oxidoreductase gamma subunit
MAVGTYGAHRREQAIRMEREVIITGIGGQGIQLMAKVLAQAAAAEDRRVMLFGIYMGMMRGGASDSTVVIGDEEISAPPIIPATWAVVAMHPAGLPALAQKLRHGGVLVSNTTLVTAGVGRSDVSILGLPATRIAEEAGNLLGAGMVALGAFVAATGLVRYDSVVNAMRASLPPHRQHLAESNVRFLDAGRDYAASHLSSPTTRAWPDAVAAPPA